MSEPILTAIADGIATVTVNRPEARNALTPAMMDTITAFLHQIEHDENVGAVILASAGDHFVSGGDMKGFAEKTAQSPERRASIFEMDVHRMNPMFLAMERIPQMVIARVRGFAAGSGLSLVAAADLAIASETAKFLLAHVKVAGSPDAGASYFLPRQVGMKRAKEIVCLGDVFGAEEAHRMGLVNRVVANDRLDDEVLALAKRFATGARRAVGEAKQLLNQSLDNTLAQQLYEEAKAVARVVATEDFVEGAKAFGEKRAPRYRGR